MSYNKIKQKKYFNLIKSSNSNDKSDSSIEISPNNFQLDINYLKIINLCSKKLLMKPNNKRALLLRASIYIKISKFQEAENDLLPLLNDINLASTAYYLLGIINKETNNNEVALKYLTKSIELDNNNINAYFLRGAINNIIGDYKNAIKDYNYALYKDTLNTDGKNIYKKISRIFTQTLNKQKNNSKKKKRKISLINNRKNNYIINKFQIIFNSEKPKIKNKIKCNSEEKNLKMKTFTKYINEFKTENDNGKNLHNIFVNSTSDNFNFFIRNIAYKKANDKCPDAYNLFNEIKGYLNEEDNDEKQTLSLYLCDKEEIKKRNNHTFPKSIISQENENISPYKKCNINSSLLSNNTNNISNEFIKSNKSPSSSKFQNNIYKNLCQANKIKSSSIKKSKSFYIDNPILEIYNNYNKIFYNSHNKNYNNYIYINNNKITDNQNEFKPNNNLIIEKKQNNELNNNKNIKQEQFIISNSPFSYESSNSILNYSKEKDNNYNKKLIWSPYETNLKNFNAFCLEKKPEKNELEESLSEDEILCINGEKERNKGNYKEAINLFTKSIQINPNSFKAFFNRAFTFDKIGLYNQAICDYTSTITLKPNHSFCFYNRGITYNKMGDYEKSIYDFTKAIQLEPNKPEFYFNRACLFKNTKQYQNAINDYTRVISLFPKLYTPVYNRGICYEKLRIYQSSIKDFEACTKMAKNNIHPLYHLATIYKILEKYDKSMDYLKKVIEIKPDYSPAYHDIGVILTQLGDNQSAIKYFNKSIELDGKKPIYYHNRGWAFRKINPQNAINDITMAINLDNKNLKFYYNRAYIYKIEKMYDKAIEDYSIIILKFDHNNFESYINRAFCFAQRNNYYDAINDYKKALDIKNNDYNCLCSRADLYINIKEYFLAIEDLNKIIKINPNNEKVLIMKKLI